MGSVIFPLYSMYFWWAFIFLSIRLRGKLSSRKIFIFGCKIVQHVLYFAVTQLNIAYFVKIECSKTKRTVIRWWTLFDNLFQNDIQFEILSLWDPKGIHFSFTIKNKNQYRKKYILQDVTKPIICLPSISLKNRLIELMLFTLLLLTNVRRK